MTIKIDNATINKIRLVEQGADPDTPASNHGYLYCKNNGIYFKQDDGTIIGPLGVSYTEGARVYNNAAIECITENDIYLTFNSEDFDTDTIHDTGSNTSRLTCKTAGKYVIVGNLSWEANSDGARLVYIELNRTSTIAYWTITDATGAGGERLTITTIYDLAVDDYVELVCWQNSGVTVDINYTAKYSPNFMMQRIG